VAVNEAQLSDEVDGATSTEGDARRLICLAKLASLALDALAKVCNRRRGEAVPFVPRESLAAFVQIESV
jgi:hypothetical protein